MAALYVAPVIPWGRLAPARWTRHSRERCKSPPVPALARRTRGGSLTLPRRLHVDRSTNLALRRGRALVGRVQPDRPRDRLLPPLRRARPAGARRRLRHRTAAPPVPARRPRRRRLRHLARHARALPGSGRERGALANRPRAGDARARPATPVPDDLRLRRPGSRQHAGAGSRGAATLPRPPGARRDVRARQPGAVCRRSRLAVLAEGEAFRVARAASRAARATNGLRRR